MALIAFAVCILIGGFQAGNPFTTTVERAMAAMAGTFVVALVVGAMGKKMIEESLRQPQERLKNKSMESAGDDR
jgi:hypothetical protein